MMLTTKVIPVLTVGPINWCPACGGEGREYDDVERVVLQCDCVTVNILRARRMLYNLGYMIDHWLGIPGDGAFTPAFELAANGVTAE